VCDDCAKGPLGPKKYSYYKGDMTVVGSLFGFILEYSPYEGTGGEFHQRTLVHVFIEDDELYHYKYTFDTAWLPDLLKVVFKSLQHLNANVPEPVLIELINAANKALLCGTFSKEVS
jgi:hypothetical protein